MPLKVEKWSGIGNDFYFIDGRGRDVDYSVWSEFAQETATDHDGLVVLLDNSQKADYRMGFWNPDGSNDFCGNGVRCLAGFLEKSLSISSHGKTIESFFGQIVAYDTFRGQYLVDMGTPKLVMESPQLFDFGIETFSGYVIDTGSLHCIIFVDELPQDEIFHLSSIIENDSLFPRGTSVVWAEKQNANNLAIRIWERGAGETKACATGACAAVWWSYELGYTNKNVTVASSGGKLNINLGDNIIQSGEVSRLW